MVVVERIVSVASYQSLNPYAQPICVHNLKAFRERVRPRHCSGALFVG